MNSPALFDTYLRGINRRTEIGTLAMPDGNPVLLSSKGVGSTYAAANPFHSAPDFAGVSIYTLHGRKIAGLANANIIKAKGRDGSRLMGVYCAIPYNRMQGSAIIAGRLIIREIR